MAPDTIPAPRDVEGDVELAITAARWSEPAIGADATQPMNLDELALALAGLDSEALDG